MSINPEITKEINQAAKEIKQTYKQQIEQNKRFKTPSQDLNIEQELKKCYRAIRYCQTFSNFTQPKP